MARTAIVFGGLLAALGLGSCFGADQAGWTTWITALLPAVFGLVILALGVAALNNSWRARAMHAAVVAGLLGFFATAYSLVELGQLLVEKQALLARAMMAVLCGVFVAMSIKSLLDARRRKPPAAEPPPEKPPAEKPSAEAPTT
jgi:hypothetical protein